MSGPLKKVCVRYYALLREQSGRSEETLETQAETAEELYKELEGKYGFRLSSELLKVAINDEFRDLNTKLKNDDTIIFIPPVAGG